ncbi:MAG: AAA family ATPase [Xanthomonadales bacterium]|nr:AAA family ATPase [Xanthomonadales bacterium]
MVATKLEQSNVWPYPGSRWWKFDFHTHTPASLDTPWCRQELELSPEQWLLRFMEAEIDCVAVTDHNSGAWVDLLKAAYEGMKAQRPEAFRELTLFPGVEISVQGGFHLLVLLDPARTTADIDTLIGKVNYNGTKGDSDGVTRRGAGEVVDAVLESGGLPILAHADGDKGLLAVREGTRECRLDANTVLEVLDTEGLLAMEWLDMAKPLPERVAKRAGRLARVLGSDCHSFQGNGGTGSRHTWVKMAAPTLEGLRLALLDGNGISIRRSDEGPFEPFRTPTNYITGIEVESARFMGNGQPERLALTPYYNALIGGRGTGKSTVVHATRLALRRDDDLKHLTDKSDPRRQFEDFRRSVKGREGEGALRENTEIRVELICDGVAHRLRWRADNTGDAVEERGEDGLWVVSASQAVHAERFPIRLFSQGQIAAMAGDSRQALLDVIDQAANIAPLHRAFDDVRRTYLTQSAKMREFDGQLSGGPELQRKQIELNRKIEALAQSHHADVLKAHQQAQRQRRDVGQALEQLRALPARIEAAVRDIQLDAWPDGAFDLSQDADVLAWRRDVEAATAEVRDALSRLTTVFQGTTEALGADNRLATWRLRVDTARQNHESLQVALAAEGVADPQAFGRLVEERQQLDVHMKRLEQIGRDRDRLQGETDEQWLRLTRARAALSQARSTFVAEALRANEFVRIEVVPYGFDAKIIERDLRELLDVTGDRFEGDILQLRNDVPAGGLAFQLAQSDDRGRTVETIKERLISSDGDFGGHFRNYLERKRERPEFADHIRCWFPTDDLRIEYSRTGNGRDWSAISQGSQGQRSAALLAFLLAFGDEPLVLDQPEDDLDNHLIYDLIVRQIRANKLRRQLIIVTHNPNVVVNGDAEMVHPFDFRGGQCRVVERGALQEPAVREEVCRVMEGGHEAFARRWARLGRAP